MVVKRGFTTRKGLNQFIFNSFRVVNSWFYATGYTCGYSY